LSPAAPRIPVARRPPLSVCRRFVTAPPRTSVSACPSCTASPRRGGWGPHSRCPVDGTPLRAEALRIVPPPLQSPRRLVRFRIPVHPPRAASADGLPRHPFARRRHRPVRPSPVDWFRLAVRASSSDPLSLVLVRVVPGSVPPSRACVTTSEGRFPPGTGPGLVVRLFSAAPCFRRNMGRRSHRRQPWLPSGPPRPVLLPKEPDRRFRPR
jgi:hypothetical protein